jgi:hypothetical protein
VVLGQPLDVVVQRVETRRRQDAHLAHAAAEPLADQPGLGDALPGADHERADRRTQALGEADRQRVEQPAVRGQRHPVGHVRVPDAGAVAVQQDVAGPGAQRLQGGQRHDRPAAQVVGLLHRDRRGRHRRIAGRPDHRGDLGRVEGGTDRRPRTGGQPTQRRGRTQFVRHHVRVGPREQFPAARGDQLQRDLVGHRAGRAEQRRLMPEQLGDPLLQQGDGRVVAEDVVADRGVHHRRPHAGRRPGNSVGT